MVLSYINDKKTCIKLPNTYKNVYSNFNVIRLYNILLFRIGLPEVRLHLLRCWQSLWRQQIPARVPRRWRSQGGILFPRSWRFHQNCGVLSWRPQRFQRGCTQHCSNSRSYLHQGCPRSHQSRSYPSILPPLSANNTYQFNYEHNC